MIKMPTLTRDSFVRSRATLEILLWRHGFLPGLTALAVLAAILVWAWFLPAQDRAYDQAVQGLAHQERAAGQQSVDAKGRPLPPLARFEDVLSDPADTNAIVRDIFQAAQDAGITIAQVEYRRVSDNNERYSQLQIAMPVRAEYPAFRRFCELLLQRVPSLSIDQMNIRREAPGRAQIEVQLILSLWQKPLDGVAVPLPREGSR